MSLFGSLCSAIRQKVSRDKTRFADGRYNLDLTYITDRIIAMAYPGNGMEGTYRNNILDVSAMLNEYHRGHFCIYNLSGRKYDHAIFDEKNPECVQDWCYFPDHNPPPIPLVFKLLMHMHNFLTADDQNVIIVHCLAGKGRTGTLIACYMMYVGLFSKAIEALNFFAFKRSVTINGVTYPGQKRYVTYMQNILDNANPVVPDSTPIYLKSVTITRVPKLFLSRISHTFGITPLIEIFSLADEKTPKMVFSSAWSGPPESYPYDPRMNKEEDTKDISIYGNPIIIPVNKILRGDILITLNHCQTLSKQQQVLLRLNFHTGFLHFDAKNIMPHASRKGAVAEDSPQAALERELLKRKKEEETLLKFKSMSMPSLPSQKSMSSPTASPAGEEDPLYTVSFPKEKLDCITDDGRFPDSFNIVLAYQSGDTRMNPLEAASIKKVVEEEERLRQLALSKRPHPALRNGEMCFFGVAMGEKITRARSQAGTNVAYGTLIEKKGWLVKQGQKVKSWKKRWFILRDNLTYFGSATSSAPKGIISLEKIISVTSVDGLCDSSHQYCFEIVVDLGCIEESTENMELRSYLICANNEDEMNDWVEAINLARMEKKSRKLQLQ